MILERWHLSWLSNKLSNWTTGILSVHKSFVIIPLFCTVKCSLQLNECISGITKDFFIEFKKNPSHHLPGIEWQSVVKRQEMSQQQVKYELLEGQRENRYFLKFLYLPQSNFLVGVFLQTQVLILPPDYTPNSPVCSVQCDCVHDMDNNLPEQFQLPPKIIWLVFSWLIFHIRFFLGWSCFVTFWAVALLGRKIIHFQGLRRIWDIWRSLIQLCFYHFALNCKKQLRIMKWKRE